MLNSFPTSGDFYCRLITFANSLDPDQAQQNVGPDLDPDYLTLDVIPKRFFWKVNFQKKKKKKKSKSTEDKKACKLPSMQKVKGSNSFL